MTEVEELELERSQYCLAIARLDWLDKLQKSGEWRMLMKDGFMGKDCARYTHASVDTSIGKEQREDALHIAQASGYLKKYLEVIQSQGQYAKNRLPELEKAIEEARSSAV